MSRSRGFVKKNFVSLVAQALISVRGFLVVPLLIKTVGNDKYGEFVLLFSFLNFFYGISSLGSGFHFKRYFPAEETAEGKRRLFFPQFWFQMIVVILLGGLLAVSANQVNLFVFGGKIPFHGGFAALFILAYAIFSQCCDYFRYDLKIEQFNIIIIGFQYLSLATMFVAGKMAISLNVDSLVLAHTVVAGLLVIPALIYIFKMIGFSRNFYERGQLIQDIKLGFPLVLGFVVDSVLAFSDRYLIGRVLSVAEVAYYSLPYAVASLILFLPKVTGVALLPFLAKKVDVGDETSARDMINVTATLFLMVSMPFCVGIAMLEQPLLRFLGTEETARNAHAVGPIVAVGSVFYGLTLIFSNALYVKLKTNAMFRVNLVASVVNVVLNAVLLKMFPNILVCALTTLICYALSFLICIRNLRMTWQIKLYFIPLLKGGVASLIMALVLWYHGQFFFHWTDSLAIYCASSVGIGILTYGVVLLLLRVVSRKDAIKLMASFG